MKKPGVIVFALIGGGMLALSTAAGVAHASVKPLVGVQNQWNRPMCGTSDWERVKTPATEYAVIDSSGTCVTSERYHGDFNVSGVLADKSWQYPSIVAGYVPTGEATCASPADTCDTFPVQVKDDGTPLVSFGSWISSGFKGNESLDIWFSPVKSRHSIDARNGDTELMIWTAWPGVSDELTDYTTIDGKRFGIMTWEAGHDGQEWRYVAYLWLGASQKTGRQVNISRLWLNPFFRNAESHGWLRSDEYLWSVATGFEMNQGGLHNNIHNLSLSGMPTNR